MHPSVEFLRAVAMFLVVLGVLVFIHELGHYLAARWRGVHAEVFSIGFGPKIVSWTDRRQTEWRICWLPLGGYVKMHGWERPEDVAPEVRESWVRERAFNEKSIGSRAIVVAAGPVANFVLAAVLFALLFATAGREKLEPVAGAVEANSPAAMAGLAAGDRILAVGGEPVRQFEDIPLIVLPRPDQDLALRFEHDGQTHDVTVHVGTRTAPDGSKAGMIGIRSGPVTFERLDPASAVVAGVAHVWHITTATLSGIWEMITGHRGTEDIGGPLRIAQLSGEVAGLGLATVINFIAVLSVNLGLINLFPIPILDGGHLLFYIAEALRGRPLPSRATEYGYRLGLMAIICLFVFATWNDLTHLGLFRWVASLIG